MPRFNLVSAGRIAGSALALSASIALSGCGSMPDNRSMNSVHQPVVETVNYTLDIRTSGSGLAYGEQARLAQWFVAMGAKYGDRIYVDDPAGSPATISAIESVSSVHGLALSQGAPITSGSIPGGSARIVLTRIRAHVPGCPNWSTQTDFNPNNGLSSNYGCATNSNFAAMVANPEELLRGSQNPADVVVSNSNKAIGAYRKATPTGNGGTSLPAASSKGE